MSYISRMKRGADVVAQTKKADRPRGRVCLLVSEFDDALGRRRRLGERDTQFASRHRELIHATVMRHGGFAADWDGYGGLVVFAEVAAAVAAALDLQFAMDAERWPGELPLTARIGIHVGDVDRYGDQYVAPTVHQAVRIARAARGGQILLSAEAVTATGAQLVRGCTFRDLGAQALRDFGTPQHLYQACFPGLRSHFPLPRVQPPERYRLAQPDTSFVGRSEEIARLAQALRRHRRVNLVGPAGIGKTRLALETGELLLPVYADGVWYIDLAQATDDETVAERCAAALGLADDLLVSPLDTLPRQMEAQAALLILDHTDLATAAASRLSARLALAPEIRVLLLSREPAQGSGEIELRLGPLPWHAQGETLSPAAQLVLERIPQRGQNAQPPTLDRAELQELARRLGGLPLALEWVAGQAGRSPLPELIQDLSASPSVSGTVIRADGATRRDLHAVFEWTYARLTRGERKLLQGLAVFSHGWDADGARAVAADPDATPQQRARDLSNLVTSGLIVRSRIDGVARERLAPALRERLLASLRPGEVEALHDRFVRWALTYAEAPDATGDPSARLLQWRLELGNLRTAAAIADRSSHRLATRLMAALMPITVALGARREAIRWGERAERLATADPRLRARILIGLGSLLHPRQPPQAEHALREALALAVQSQDMPLRLDALRHLAVAARDRGELPELERLLLEQIGLLQARDDAHARFAAQGELATLMLHQGRDAETLSDLQRLLLEAEDQGWRFDAAGLRRHLAHGLVNLGRPQEALHVAERGAAEFRALGSPAGVAQLLSSAGLAWLHLGDATQARRHFLEAGRIALQVGATRLVPEVLERLAAVEVEAGRIETAARYVYAADSLYEAAGYAREPVDHALRADVGRHLRAQLDAQTLGHLQTESLLQARQILAEVIAALPA